MQLDTLARLRTDPSLLAAVRNSAVHPLTSQEVVEQKVSFVYASFSNESGVTKDGVRAMILRQGGVIGQK